MSTPTTTVKSLGSVIEAAWGWRKRFGISVRDGDRATRHVRIYTGRAHGSPIEGEISLTFANARSTWTTEVRMDPVEALKVAEGLSAAARRILEADA